MRIVQNNSDLWCQRKTTQFRLENENSEPQMWDKHDHWSFLPFNLPFTVNVSLNLSMDICRHHQRLNSPSKYHAKCIEKS